MSEVLSGPFQKEAQKTQDNSPVPDSDSSNSSSTISSKSNSLFGSANKNVSIWRSYITIIPITISILSTIIMLSGSFFIMRYQIADLKSNQEKLLVKMDEYNKTLTGLQVLIGKYEKTQYYSEKEVTELKDRIEKLESK